MVEPTKPKPRRFSSFETRSESSVRAGTSLSYQGFQNLTIHGRVPAQTVGGTGTFTDSVSFTVTY